MKQIQPNKSLQAAKRERENWAGGYGVGQTRHFEADARCINTQKTERKLFKKCNALCSMPIVLSFTLLRNGMLIGINQLNSFKTNVHIKWTQLSSVVGQFLWTCLVWCDLPFYTLTALFRLTIGGGVWVLSLRRGLRCISSAAHFMPTRTVWRKKLSSLCLWYCRLSRFVWSLNECTLIIWLNRVCGCHGQRLLSFYLVWLPTRLTICESSAIRWVYGKAMQSGTWALQLLCLYFTSIFGLKSLHLELPS